MTFAIKRKTKKLQAIENEFNAQLVRALAERFPSFHLNYGFLKGMYSFGVNTRFGLLVIEPHGSWVAMRFENVGHAATLLFTCDAFNPHSGKYNVHFEDDAPIASRIAAVVSMIEKVESRSAPG